MNLRRCALGLIALTFVSSTSLSTHAIERAPKLIYATSFRRELTSDWVKVDGRYVKAGNVVVHNGVLNLWCRPMPDHPKIYRGAEVVLQLPQRYARYVIRVRAQRASWTRVNALLWPLDEQYPPEVDFYEMGNDDRARQRNYLSAHYLDSAGVRHIEHRSYDANLRRWHRISVSLRRHRIVFELDGHVMANHWGNLTTRITNAGIHEALKLHLKTITTRRPSKGFVTPWPASPSKLQIDWVKVYD